MIEYLPRYLIMVLPSEPSGWQRQHSVSDKAKSDKMSRVHALVLYPISVITEGLRIADDHRLDIAHLLSCVTYVPYVDFQDNRSPPSIREVDTGE